MLPKNLHRVKSLGKNQRSNLTLSLIFLPHLGLKFLRARFAFSDRDFFTGFKGVLKLITVKMDYPVAHIS